LFHHNLNYFIGFGSPLLVTLRNKPFVSAVNARFQQLRIQIA